MLRIKGSNLKQKPDHVSESKLQERQRKCKMMPGRFIWRSSLTRAPSSPYFQA